MNSSASNVEKNSGIWSEWVEQFNSEDERIAREAYEQFNLWLEKKQPQGLCRQVASTCLSLLGKNTEGDGRLLIVLGRLGVSEILKDNRLRMLEWKYGHGGAGLQGRISSYLSDQWGRSVAYLEHGGPTTIEIQVDRIFDACWSADLDRRKMGLRELSEGKALISGAACRISGGKKYKTELDYVMRQFTRKLDGVGPSSAPIGIEDQITSLQALQVLDAEAGIVERFFETLKEGNPFLAGIDPVKVASLRSVTHAVFEMFCRLNRLGLTVRPISVSERKMWKLKEGVVVDLVTPGGPAAEVNIQPGWVLWKIEKKSIESVSFLKEVLFAYSLGSRLELQCIDPKFLKQAKKVRIIVR